MLATAAAGWARTSSSPAKMVYSPLNGFLRKKSSKTEGDSCRLFFQYAYAMEIWYRSVNSGVTELLYGIPTAAILEDDALTQWERS